MIVRKKSAKTLNKLVYLLAICMKNRRTMRLNTDSIGTDLFKKRTANVGFAFETSDCIAGFSEEPGC